MKTVISILLISLLSSIAFAGGSGSGVGFEDSMMMNMKSRARSLMQDRSELTSLKNSYDKKVFFMDHNEEDVSFAATEDGLHVEKKTVPKINLQDNLREALEQSSRTQQWENVTELPTIPPRSFNWE